MVIAAKANRTGRSFGPSPCRTRLTLWPTSFRRAVTYSSSFSRPDWNSSRSCKRSLTLLIAAATASTKLPLCPTQAHTMPDGRRRSAATSAGQRLAHTFGCLDPLLDDVPDDLAGRLHGVDAADE